MGVHRHVQASCDKAKQACIPDRAALRAEFWHYVACRKNSPCNGMHHPYAALALWTSMPYVTCLIKPNVASAHQKPVVRSPLSAAVDSPLSSASSYIKVRAGVACNDPAQPIVMSYLPILLHSAPSCDDNAGPEMTKLSVGSRQAWSAPCHSAVIWNPHCPQHPPPTAAPLGTPGQPTVPTLETPTLPTDAPTARGIGHHPAGAFQGSCTVSPEGRHGGPSRRGHPLFGPQPTPEVGAGGYPLQQPEGPPTASSTSLRGRPPPPIHLPLEPPGASPGAAAHGFNEADRADRDERSQPTAHAEAVDGHDAAALQGIGDGPEAAESPTERRIDTQPVLANGLQEAVAAATDVASARNVAEQVPQPAHQPQIDQVGDHLPPFVRSSNEWQAEKVQRHSAQARLQICVVIVQASPVRHQEI